MKEKLQIIVDTSIGLLNEKYAKVRLPKELDSVSRILKQFRLKLLEIAPELIAKYNPNRKHLEALNVLLSDYERLLSSGNQCVKIAEMIILECSMLSLPVALDSNYSVVANDISDRRKRKSFQNVIDDYRGSDARGLVNNYIQFRVDFYKISRIYNELKSLSKFFGPSRQKLHVFSQVEKIRLLETIRFLGEEFYNKNSGLSYTPGNFLLNALSSQSVLQADRIKTIEQVRDLITHLQPLQFLFTDSALGPDECISLIEFFYYFQSVCEVVICDIVSFYLADLFPKNNPLVSHIKSSERTFSSLHDIALSVKADIDSKSLGNSKNLDEIINLFLVHIKNIKATDDHRSNLDAFNEKNLEYIPRINNNLDKQLKSLLDNTHNVNVIKDTILKRLSRLSHSDLREIPNVDKAITDIAQSVIKDNKTSRKSVEVRLAELVKLVPKFELINSKNIERFKLDVVQSLLEQLHEAQRKVISIIVNNDYNTLILTHIMILLENNVQRIRCFTDSEHVNIDKLSMVRNDIFSHGDKYDRDGIFDRSQNNYLNDAVSFLKQLIKNNYRDDHIWSLINLNDAIDHLGDVNKFKEKYGFRPTDGMIESVKAATGSYFTICSTDSNIRSKRSPHVTSSHSNPCLQSSDISGLLTPEGDLDSQKLIYALQNALEENNGKFYNYLSLADSNEVVGSHKEEVHEMIKNHEKINRIKEAIKVPYEKIKAALSEFVNIVITPGSKIKSESHTISIISEREGFAILTSDWLFNNIKAEYTKGPEKFRKFFEEMQKSGRDETLSRIFDSITVEEVKNKGYPTEENLKKIVTNIQRELEINPKGAKETLKVASEAGLMDGNADIFTDKKIDKIHIVDNDTFASLQNQVKGMGKISISKKVIHFFANPMHLIMAKDLISGILRGDYEGVQMNVSLMLSDIVLARFAQSLTIAGESALTSSNLARGRLLKVSAPFVSRLSTIVMLHNLYRQVEHYGSVCKELESKEGELKKCQPGTREYEIAKGEYKKCELDRQDAIVHITCTSIFCVEAACSLGLEVGAALGFSCLEGALAVAGPVGTVLCAATMAASSIYSSVRQVQEISNKIRLTTGEEVEQFFRGLILSPSQYLLNLMQQKDVNEHLLTGAINLLRENTNIRKYVFPSAIIESNIPKISESVKVLLDQSIRKKRINEKWSRTIPDSSNEAKFFCLPKTSEDKGQTVSTGGKYYECENAIGLEYKGDIIRTGNSNLINLGSGSHTVTGFQGENNMFRLAEGSHKEVLGGYRDDIFVLETHEDKGIFLSSRLDIQKLDGSGGTDTIDVGGLKTKHYRDYELFSDFYKIHADFPHNSLRSFQISVNMHNINNYLGIYEQADRVTANCDIKHIDTRGGSKQDYDVVIIPENSSCKYSTSVVADSYTKIYNNAKYGKFTYIVQGEAQINVGNSEKCEHTFVFDSELKDISDIKLDKNQLRISFNEVITKKRFIVDINASNKNNLSYYFKDNTKVIFGDKVKYALQNIDKPVENFIQQYSNVAQRLNMHIVSHGNDETLMVGSGYNDVIANDPKAKKTHLVGGGGSNLIVLNSGTKCSDYSCEKLTLEKLPLSQVVVYDSHRYDNQDTVDLLELRRQVKEDLKKETDVVFTTKDQDLTLGLIIDDDSKQEVVSILLKSALENSAYKRFSVLLDTIPMKINRSNENTFSLEATPLVFDSNKTTLYIITPDDIMNGRNIQVMRSIGNYIFARGNDNELFLTNVFNNDVEAEHSITVMFRGFYHESNRKSMEKVVIEFYDKKVSLCSEKLKIDSSKNFDEINIQYMEITNKSMFLFLYVRKNDLEGLRNIIENGGDINIRDHDGCTLLHVACANDNLNIAEFLIKNGAKIDARTNDGKTPIELASDKLFKDQLTFIINNALEKELFNRIKMGKKEDIYDLQKLIAQGIGINSQDQDKKTPLHYAFEHKLFEIVKSLINRGDKINVKDKYGKVCSDYISSNNEEWIYITKDLEERLFHSIENGNIDYSQKLINQGVNLNIIRGYQRSTLAHVSVETGNLDMFNFIINSGIEVNVRDIDNKTPLHYAVHNGNVEIINNLIRCKGIQLNVLDNLGKSPLHYAVQGEESLDVVNLLVMESGVSVNIPDKSGKTPLHHAIELDNLEIIDKLVTRGSHFDFQTENDKESPLHSICKEKKLTILNYILEKNIDVNFSLVDKDGKSPLQLLLESEIKDREVILSMNSADIEKLVNNGSSFINQGSTTALHIAIRKGTIEMLKDIISQSNDSYDNLENKLLNILKKRGTPDVDRRVSRYINQQKINYINSVDSIGRTTLHYASERGERIDLLKHLVENLEELLTKGAETLFLLGKNKENHIRQKLGTLINATDRDLNTTLHIALKMNLKEIIRYLLEKGADPAIGENEITPIYLEVVRFLIEKNDNLDKSDQKKIVYTNRGSPLGNPEGYLEDYDNERPPVKDVYGRTRLHYAAQVPDIDLIDELMKVNYKRDFLKAHIHRSSLPSQPSSYQIKKMAEEDAMEKQKYYCNEGDNQNVRPIHLAAHSGLEEVLKYLEKKGAEVDISDKYGQNALHYAVRGGKKYAIEYLLRKNLSVNSADKTGVTPLYIAVHRGNEEIVRLLLEKDRIEIDQKNNNGITPLYIAVREGNSNIIKHLIHKPGVDINAMDNYTGKTILHLAVEKSDQEIVELLIKRSVRLDGVDKDGLTPLHYAVNKENLTIIQSILVGSSKKRVNITDKKDKNGKTALHYAVEKNNREIVAAIITNSSSSINAIDNSGKTPLYYAITKGNLDILKILAEKGARIDIPDLSKKTPLQYASEQESLDIVNYILDNDKDITSNINAVDSNGKSALHYAVQASSIDVVKLLIQNGAKMNLADLTKKTPLHYAAERGNLDIVNYIIKNNKGITSNINNLDSSGKSPLHYAIQVGNLDLVKLLIGKGAKISLPDSNKKIPLHYAAKQGNLNVVNYILENDNDIRNNINAIDSSDRSPIQYAVENGHLEIVKRLVDNNANIGTTILHSSVKGGNLEVIKYLLEDRKMIDLINKVDKDRKQPLDYSIGQEGFNFDLIKYLLKNEANCERSMILFQCIINKDIDINKKDKYGITPISYAVTLGNVELINFLIERIKAEDRLTPIHYAVQWKNRELIRRLVDLGYNINAQAGPDGITPLHIAVRENNIDQVMHLVKNHYADYDVPSKGGNMPIHDAVEKGYIDIVKIFLENGQSVEVKGSGGMTPLHVACHSSNYALASYLIGQEDADFLAITDDGKIPLHYAVTSLNKQLLDLLIQLQEKEDIIRQDKSGRTVFHYAAISKSLDMIKSLFVNKLYIPATRIPAPAPAPASYSRGSYQGLNTTDNLGMTCLHYAAQFKAIDIVNHLLHSKTPDNDELTVDVNDVDNNKMMPIHYACSVKNNLEVVKSLVEKYVKNNPYVFYSEDRYRAMYLHTPDRHGRIARHSADTNSDRVLLKYIDEIDSKYWGSLYRQNQLSIQYCHWDDCPPSTIFNNMMNSYISDRSVMTLLVDPSYNTERLDYRNDDRTNHLGTLPAQEIIVENLLDVIRNNDKQWLSKHKANLNPIGNNGETLLHIAALKGYLEVIKYLVSKHADIYAKDNNIMTMMHYAAKGGNIEVIKWLIDKDVEVDTKSKEGKTPLQFAASTGHLPAMKYLISQGADLYATNRDQVTTLHYAVEGNNEEVIEYLLKKGFDINASTHRGKTPIHYAAQKGSLEIIKYLVEHGADVSVRGSFGNTVLHYAAERGDVEIVSYLLKQGIDINTQNHLGNTPLHSASIKGNLDVVKYLRENGADVNIENRDGEKAEDIILKKKGLISDNNQAVSRGKYTNLDELVENLFDSIIRKDNNLFIGKNDISKMQDQSGRTLLHAAASKGYMVVARYLVETASAEVDPVDNVGQTPLYSAIFNDQLEVVRYLVEECGANIFHRDNNQETPLHFAVLNSRVLIIKYLLEQGAQVNAKDHDERTPLHIAIYYNKQELAKYLIVKGKANVNVFDINGNTPMHYSSMKGNLNMIQYLVNKGADIYEENNTGKTPLDVLREKGYEVAGIIKQFKLNVTMIDAVKHNDIKKVQELIDKGANINIRDKLGQTLINHAVSNNYVNMARYLVNHGADIDPAGGFCPMVSEGNVVSIEPCATNGATSSSLVSKVVSRVKRSISGFFGDSTDMNANENSSQSIETQNYAAPIKIGRDIPRIDMNNGYSKTVTENIDINGNLLLFNVLVRKVTGEKFVPCTSSIQSISEREAMACAMSITHEFEKVLKKAAKASKTKIPQDKLGHQLYINIHPIVTASMVKGEYDKIENILHSAAKYICPEGNKNFVKLINIEIKNMLTPANSKVSTIQKDKPSYGEGKPSSLINQINAQSINQRRLIA